MSDATVIRLPHRFDYSSHRQFSEDYTPVLDNPEVVEIILDFSQVDYIDSSALGMMVLMQKKCLAKNKKVKIQGAHSSTAEILKMANMQRIIEFI